MVEQDRQTDVLISSPVCNCVTDTTVVVVVLVGGLSVCTCDFPNSHNAFHICCTNKSVMLMHTPLLMIHNPYFRQKAPEKLTSQNYSLIYHS